MIRLHDDYLLLESLNGQSIPCSPDTVSVVMTEESVGIIDQDLLKQAASAVLHYFKNDLGKETVPVGEFTQALETVLNGFGMILKAESIETELPVESFDLRTLVTDGGKGFELSFFLRLRQELKEKLEHSPRLLRFEGLRGCVKQLLGVRRWTNRCQELNDQIVEYLRECLSAESSPRSCRLVVS
jgi:hypothetical protein